MTAQRQAAMESMIDWLADEHELGRKPSKIEIAGEFDLHNMHYYIFKYKKNMLGKWLLGVCGGYEQPSDTEHCGHVFSEMQLYDPATAEQQSIAMVEMIREYWMKQAAAIEAEQSQSDESEPQSESSGIFNGFVLLNSAECDLEQIKNNLLQDWNISYPAGEDGRESREQEGILVFDVDGFTLAVSFVDAPVPDGEAEHYAQGNYLWPGGADVVKTHVAQIILAVFTRWGSPLDSGKMYVKLAASCLKLPNAIGLYSSGTVFEPDMYLKMADIMKSEGEEEEEFPLLNLVHFGLVRTESGTNGYTNGLKPFGKEEIEIVDSQADPADLREFLIDISNYVIQYNVTLRHGETIGFSEEQKLPITRSEGVYVDGESLKIGF
ncbi:DUF4261 domain-containing protein [Paenibacillus sp. Marseille-P2973]|uniref:DUF4261 domain-containing protein n=1 Tax=Paenibacillus sp. Marseille-P2973 TaxID=1871032 RepID=UPI001B377968|nr:DUF4261 domain-containing protein [Paenibacillus sp. Marseille-P2973]MBQ4899816.1 DUF4261 domain-containing protein [Paenibacillus sp. Marseille-P2973]